MHRPLLSQYRLSESTWVGLVKESKSYKGTCHLQMLEKNHDIPKVSLFRRSKSKESFETHIPNLDNMIDKGTKVGDLTQLTVIKLEFDILSVW